MNQETPATGSSLARFAWLSIPAALATITLKAAAYLLTGRWGCCRMRWNPSSTWRGR